MSVEETIQLDDTELVLYSHGKYDNHCRGCGELINRGTRHVRNATYDGGPTSIAICPLCIKTAYEAIIKAEDGELLGPMRMKVFSVIVGKDLAAPGEIPAIYNTYELAVEHVESAIKQAGPGNRFKNMEPQIGGQDVWLHLDNWAMVREHEILKENVWEEV